MTDKHVPLGEYGMTAANERSAADRPRAMSLDPSEIERSQVITPPAGMPVWVDLVFPSGEGTTVKAFAQAWTPAAVYVQYVHWSVAAYAWVRPSAVKRRKLEERAS
ncbi:hypothetical protein ACX80U_17265 [Arthrobacter sp. TmT3-37]